MFIYIFDMNACNSGIWTVGFLSMNPAHLETGFDLNPELCGAGAVLFTSWAIRPAGSWLLFGAMSTERKAWIFQAFLQYHLSYSRNCAHQTLKIPFRLDTQFAVKTMH